MFVWREIGELKYLEITEFSHYGARAIFTSRLGGVSRGNYSSLNLGLHTEDDLERVLNNRKIICDVLGIKAKNLVAGEQVHGNRIKIVGPEDSGRGALRYNDSIKGIDGLLTAAEGLPLLSFYADCVPLIIMDPVKRVVGLAHAGWKGTYLKIGVKAVNKMQQEFGSNPSDCLVAIGPSISRDNYEVDDRVVEKFRKDFPYWRELVVDKGKGHYNLDLPAANKRSLVEAGVSAERIIVSDYCTFRDSKYFYSFRREGGKTDRMASMIFL